MPPPAPPRASSRRRIVAQALIPAVAMATVAIGLHVGGNDPLEGALVYGIPSPRDRVALQVMTLWENNGFREVIPIDQLEAVAIVDAKEHSWYGASNAEGIADITWDIGAPVRFQEVSFQLRDVRKGTSLVSGNVPLGRGPSTPFLSPKELLVPATEREGALRLDVAVPGGRLVTGFASRLWVRVSGTASVVAAPLVDITTEAEPGLTITPPHVRPCNEGWAELSAVALAPYVTLNVRAQADDGRVGMWSGTLPVATGAMTIDVADRLETNHSFKINVQAPPTTRRGYLEVDDTHGRVFATPFELSPSADGFAAAEVTVPPLPEGLYALVTSTDSKGPAIGSANTVGRIVAIADPATNAVPDASWLGESPCAIKSHLALIRMAPVPRWVALDGLVHKRAVARMRRLRGLWIAISSVVVAFVLEGMLLFSAVRATKTAFVESGKMTVVAGFLVALLGLGLLAALLLQEVH